MAEIWQIVATIVATVVLLGSMGGVVLLLVRVVQSSRIEKQAVANGQEVAATMRDIGHTLHDICERIATSHQNSRDAREDLRQMIGEVSRLVLDVERRLGGEIKENRDWMTMQFGKANGHGGQNVHINGGATGTQIGDGNQQK